MTGELPNRRLKLAFLGDFDGPHTRRWLHVFVERGHDVHAISFYEPAFPLTGVTLHVLRPDPEVDMREGRTERKPASTLPLHPPATVMRLIHAMRYRRAGLQRVLAEIAPDVFHAHYAVEHGFFGATAGFHPYVISCWGSDVFVEAHKLISGQIARYALRKADFVTAADPEMKRQLRRLGVKEEDLAVVPLGLTQDFMPPAEASANLQSPLSSLSVISNRALEPVYNVDRIIRAFDIVKKKLPHLFLTVANRGSGASSLQQLADELGLHDSVRFTGSVPQEVLRQYLMSANVYVSVPSSDSFALSNLEAMACGAFPILSNLPSAEGWIEPGRTGYLTIDDTVESLAGQMYDSLIRHDLRRDAVAPNRLKVEEHGMLETNMLAMEQIYYRLAGAGDSAS